MKSKFNIFKASLLTIGLYFLMIDVVLATDLNQLAVNVSTQATGVVKIGKYVAWVIGFLATFMGINGIMQAQKQNQPMTESLVKFIVGILLLSIMAIVSVGSQSTLGTEAQGAGFLSGG